MGAEWMFEGPLRRRELLRGGAGLALGLGLAGCGVGNEPAQVNKKQTEKLVKGHCMALVEERLGLEGVTDGG